MQRLSFTIVVMLTLIAGFSTLNAFGQTPKMTYEEYIAKYSATAIANMKKYGIPASITLAQALLESGAGNSDLAMNANNHFGIKCHKGWEGETYLKDDDAKNECFRKYKDPAESFKDHAEFLSTRSRYADLFKLDPTDYKGWAHGLKSAGYATNPAYAERLINLIERYDLTRFDTGKGAENNDKENNRRKPRHQKTDQHKAISGALHGREILTNNGVKYVVAKEGETLKTLADTLQLKPWMLRNYNDLSRNQEIRKGDKVYLQSKKRKGAVKSHTVQSGETLHSISQTYGVRMKNLAKLNHYTIEVVLTPGTILKLR